MQLTRYKAHHEENILEQRKHWGGLDLIILEYSEYARTAS